MLNRETDACRLCFSEADELPGLVVDKYGDLVILQLLTKGLDSAAVREVCVRVLREELDPAAIVERPDPRVRELEGLSAPTAEALYLRGAKRVAARKRECNSHLGSQFRLNGLVFHFDADSGQKTGAFLDQRTNYKAAREWAERLGATGRALDVCCYQGGFALHLAASAKRLRELMLRAHRWKWRSETRRRGLQFVGRAEVDAEWGELRVAASMKKRCMCFVRMSGCFS